MAFKSREEISALRAEQTPYTIDDMKFRDKKIHRVTVNISNQARQIDFGKTVFYATVERDGQQQRIGLIFTGQRLNDLNDGAIRKEMQAEHEANCDAGIFHDPISREMTIEGFWVPRSWKDRSGNWQKAWDLHAAKWHYTPQGADTPVEEGCLPFVKAAVAA